MKQSLKQKQKLSLNITATLSKQIGLLSLSGFEISKRLNDLIDQYYEDSDKTVRYFKEQYLVDKYKHALKFEIRDHMEQSDDETSDLRQNLLNQLEISPLDSIENLVGEFLIDSVEDNGRLDPDLDYQDIKRIVFEDFDFKITDQEIDKVLKIIQNFDPPGCAYRNIQESMDIQIDNLDLSSQQKENLRLNLKDILEEKISLDMLTQELRDNLSKLTLHPASSFGDIDSNYVRPDVVARPNGSNWIIMLNDDLISKEILEKIKTKVDGENIKNEEAKSFLNGLERRQQTLLMVSEYIVEAQKEFLRSASDKNAISNKEIANRLGISPSTVSRIVRNKFIQFPEKLIPLSQLMERRINKHNEGTDVTEERLKSLILEMIKEEDKKNPFSDQTLSRLLGENGVVISRRTISKYRNVLNIPSSRVRKT